MKPLVSIQLGDSDAERVRQSHAAALAEVQHAPAMALKVIANVSLADGVKTPVPHGLGRAPTYVRESAPRGAVSGGVINEIRDGSVDRAKYVLLQATGFGATVIVDVQVM